MSESDPYYLSGSKLSTSDLFALVNSKVCLAISKETAENIQRSRSLLEKFISDGRVIYGVNTGLGGFVNWLVPEKNSQELQENLINAVSTNVGTYFDDKYVKASIIARLNSLARGVSAISIENFNVLLEIYNKKIIPCVPAKGSLGASGDLGPLACIALVGIGEWRAKFEGEIIPGKEALKRAGIKPMKLAFKEGLSLINGTSFMTGIAAYLIEESIDLVKTYDIISALAFEGLGAKKKPFDPAVHAHKLHKGQLETSKNLWTLLSDSKMVADENALELQLRDQKKDIPSSSKNPIEDAYSIRCTPHILGSIRDNFASIKSTVNDELNSSSDNPLVLPEENDVFHNGHFHGQYIAMAMDQLSISLTTLSNLSDRRIDRFMDSSNSNGLPAFLCTKDPGLKFGLMGGQFMSTSVTAENRTLCVPASIQTLPSTADFQDIVSLGLISARRADEILTNTIYIIAFELLCCIRSAEHRGAALLSSATKKVFECVKKEFPSVSKDQCLTDLIEGLAKFIRSREILRIVRDFKTKMHC